MKTYKILTFILISFLLGAVIFEKIALKDEVEKIDRTDRFGAYYNKQELPPFRHVVLEGNNVGITKFVQGMGTRSIRYGNLMKKKMKAHVNNDTLYIKYDGSLQKNDFSALWGKNTTSLRNVLIHYDTITSIKTTKSHSYILANKLPKLDVNIQQKSWFCLHGNQVNQLSIDTENSLTTFYHGPSTHTDSLSIKAYNNSEVSLRNIFAKTDHFEISDDTKLDRNGYNESHIPE